MAKKGEIVGVVDFGSREIRVLIARRSEDGTVQIIGHGTEPSRGCISQGVLQDLSAAQMALKRAMTAAEKEAQVTLDALFCAINGKNIETFICEGNVRLDGGVVANHHLREAVDIASREILAPGKRLTSSVTAQEWYVDELPVSEPIGIHGQVLKARVHFARVPSVIMDNLVNCVESQHRRLEDFIFTPLASAQGCLTHEEMDLGVAVIDLGRSTTGLAVYRHHRILGTQCFEWGGYQITRDVAACLHITFEEADDLIMSYGISRERMDADAAPEKGGAETSGAPDLAGTPVKLKTAVHGAPTVVDRQEIETIIHARAKELLTKVRQYLHVRGLAKNLVCGLVLTGGGARSRTWPNWPNACFRRLVESAFPTASKSCLRPCGHRPFPRRLGLRGTVLYTVPRRRAAAWTPAIRKKVGYAVLGVGSNTTSSDGHMAWAVSRREAFRVPLSRS